jgi:hypothetical protein
MPKQLHKRFSSEEVKEVLERYEKNIFSLEDSLSFLKIQKRQFFVLLKNYRSNPESFSIEFKREKAPRKIDEKSEKKILLELKKESELIADKNNPIRYFNYSFLKETLEKNHKVVVSLPTIISRAKKMGIIQERVRRRSTTESYRRTTLGS